MTSSSKSVKTIYNKAAFSEMENMNNMILFTPTYIRESHTVCLSHKDWEMQLRKEYEDSIELSNSNTYIDLIPITTSLGRRGLQRK